MVRIVCHVRYRPDHVVFVWSDGQNPFKPYTLTGPACSRFLDASRQANEQLARLAAGGQVDIALAQAGHELFQAIFPEDARGAVIQGWIAREEPTAFEIVSDLPGTTPWQLVYGERPDEGRIASGHPDALRPFWGVRYPLADGGRASIWRQLPVIDAPRVLAVLDPKLRASLPEAEQQRLQDFIEDKDIQLASCRARLSEAEAVDIVYVFAPATAGGFSLDGEGVLADELRELLCEGGKPEPLLLLNLVGAESGVAQSYFQSFQGVIGPRLTTSLTVAGILGPQMLEDLLSNGQPAGRVLQKLRVQNPRALLCTVACPSSLCLGPNAEAAADLPTGSLPEQPYRPVAAYTREYRALFSGRDHDLARCSALVDEANTRLLVLQGGASVGKTSFLQAGLLPFLDQSAVGFLTLQDRTAEEALPTVLRAADDVLSQLASGLCDFCAQPYRYETPTGEAVEIDLPDMLAKFLSAGGSDTAVMAPGTPPPVPDGARQPVAGEASELWAVLRRRTTALSELLAVLAAELPAELVIPVDHVEEWYTQVESDAEKRERRQGLQALLHAAGQCKIVLAVRTDYSGLLAHELPARAKGVVEHLLEPLTDQQIIDAIVLPTATEPILFSSEAPYSKYEFLFHGDLPGRIVEGARRAASERRIGILPIVQCVCARLAVLGRERADHILRDTDLKEIGGIDDAVQNYVRAALDAMPLRSRTRQALRELCQHLYTQHPDGTLTRDLVPAPYLKERWSDSYPIQQAVEVASGDNGLFDVQRLLVGGMSGLYVSLKQESLAHVATHWQQEKSRNTYARKSIIDSLWLVIPFTLLAASIALFVWRQVFGFGAPSDTISPQANKERVQLQKQLDAQRLPLYAGQLTGAQQAWGLGNALRTNTLLISADPDVRAFEWYYLWRATHRDVAVGSEPEHLISRIAVAPDGQTVALADITGTAKLWDVKSQSDKATFKPHAIGITGVAFADHGKTLVTIGADGMLKVWDASKLTSNEPQLRHSGKHESPLTALSIDEKRGIIATGTFDNQVILWDLAKAEKKKAFKEHGGPVLAVDFSTDGAMLATGDTKGAVIVWNPDGEKHKELKYPGDQVQTIAVSPDGKLVAAGGAERRIDGAIGTVRVWDIASGTALGEPMTHGAGVVSIDFTPDGKSLVVAGKSPVIGVRDPKGQLHGELRGAFGWVRGTAFAEDGSTFAICDDSGFRVWPTSSYPALFPFARAPQYDVQQAHQGPVSGVACTPDGSIIVSAGQDGEVKIWNYDGRLQSTLSEAKNPVAAVALLGAKEPIVAVGTATPDGKGEVHLWQLERKDDAVSGKYLRSLQGADAAIHALAFSPDGKLIAAGGADKKIVLWDHASGKEAQTLEGHTAAVRALAFEKSGKYLASGGDDKLLRLWTIDSGKQVSMPEAAHGEAITTILFYLWRSAGQPRPVVVTGGLESVVMEWSLQEGKLNYVYRGHANSISALAITPDERVLLSASWDNTIKAYDTQNGPERFTFIGHKAPVHCLAIGGDPPIMISGDRTGELRFWRSLAPKDVPGRARPQTAGQLPDLNE